MPGYFSSGYGGINNRLDDHPVPRDILAGFECFRRKIIDTVDHPVSSNFASRHRQHAGFNSDRYDALPGDVVARHGRSDYDPGRYDALPGDVVARHGRSDYDPGGNYALPVTSLPDTDARLRPRPLRRLAR
ncbi:hypothetical protein GQ600_5691 [Phytophthora cactorum]|nr:hypothetical protein GQ600_5691 [Phytophthora cactorum]